MLFWFYFPKIGSDRAKQNIIINQKEISMLPKLHGGVTADMLFFYMFLMLVQTKGKVNQRKLNLCTFLICF